MRSRGELILRGALRTVLHDPDPIVDGIRLLRDSLAARALDAHNSRQFVFQGSKIAPLLRLKARVQHYVRVCNGDRRGCMRDIDGKNIAPIGTNKAGHRHQLPRNVCEFERCN